MTYTFAEREARLRNLSERFNHITIAGAGGICPFQADGTILGLPFYFRERGGAATLRISDAEHEPFGNEVLYLATMDHDGVFSDEEFVQAMLTLLPQVDKAPFLWEFNGRKLEFSREGTPSPIDPEYAVTDEVERRFGWGHTPQEGYESTQRISAYLLEAGWSEDYQHRLYADQQVDPTPLNTDDRVFPETTPDFASCVR